MTTRPGKPFLRALIPPTVITALVALALGGLYMRSEAGKPAPGTAAAGSQVASTEVGAILPDFTLQRFGGKAIKASELKGKVTLVNFWATWCEACVVEMPSIVSLRDSFKSKGLDVVAVSMDENPDQVLQRSLKKFKIDFPVYVDPTSKLADLFSIDAIPLTLVIDSHRKVLYRENGGRDWNDAEMRKMMERWLSG